MKDRFWDASNWLTAFAVAQGLTFVGFLVTDNAFQKIIAKKEAALATIAATAFMTAAYFGAIW